MRYRWLAVAIAIGAIAAAPALASATGPLPSAPPSVAAVHSTSLAAVPKFIFHAGLAFGAFHHFIYLPFKAGKFTSGSFFSKLKNYVEAGLAGLFVYHEVKLALQDAQQNRVLKLLVAPLTGGVAVFSTIESKIKSHSLDSGTISSAENAITSIEKQAKSSGSSISEAIPTAKQLATGSA